MKNNLITKDRKVLRKNRANAGLGQKIADPITTLSMAEMALAAGNSRRALDLAGRLLAVDADHLPALELYARAQWQLSDLEGLGTTIEKMILLNPYEPGYFSLLGAVEQSRGRTGAAVRALNRCLKLSTTPDSSVVAMLQELKKFQSILLGQLIEEDPIFRVQYRKNPVEAARSRGFEIESTVVETRTQVQPRPALLFARPS